MRSDWRDLGRRVGALEAAGGGGGGSASWGSIGGTLSSQTDLSSALDGKAAIGHTHVMSDVSGLAAALDGKAPLASPVFSGTVTLPAGQVVNGVTLVSTGSSSNYLREDGTYGVPVVGSNNIDGGSAVSLYGGVDVIDGGGASG